MADATTTSARESANAARASARRDIARLRHIGLAEGVSFLVLLGIAMPLKYIWGYPMAVKVVGWAHGLLLIALLVALHVARRSAGWSLRHASMFAFAALLPFGPFVMDRKLRREADAR